MRDYNMEISLQLYKAQPKFPSRTSIVFHHHTLASFYSTEFMASLQLFGDGI